MPTNQRFTTSLREGLHIISTEIPGLNEIIVQSMFALLTKEHMLWYSPPGRAKSMMARRLFGLFPNAKTFSTAFSIETTMADIFGADIPDDYLKDGRVIFNLDDGIVDCHLAYLDEFFDAHEKILRALLPVLHDRVFERKDQQQTSPLHSAIMTTNFYTETGATEAILDRILCKAIIPRIAELSDRVRMYDSYLSGASSSTRLPELDIEELVELARFVESPDGILVPDDVKLMHGVLLEDFANRRLEARAEGAGSQVAKELTDVMPGITPRTEAKLLDSSRAAAALDGRQMVEPNDLKAMRYSLVTIGDDSPDSEVWVDACDNVLPNTVSQEKAWTKLGQAAEALARIKNESSLASAAEIRLGGGVVVKGRAGIAKLLDVKGSNQVIRETADRLSAEFDQVVHDVDAHLEDGRYDLLRGFS